MGESIAVDKNRLCANMSRGRNEEKREEKKGGVGVGGLTGDRPPQSLTEKFGVRFEDS